MGYQKPKKFEQVKHGTFTADIRLSKDTGVFSCEYGGDSFGNTSLAEVRKWAIEKLRTMSRLDWKPIIEIHTDNEDVRVNNLRTCSNLEMCCERYRIAWDGKRWVQCPWSVLQRGHHMCIGPQSSDMNQEDYPMSDDELNERRIAHSHQWYGPSGQQALHFPIVQEGRGKICYIPYTEEQWAVCLGILDRIRELRTSINKMMTTESGWGRLAQISQTKLLAAPK